MHVRFAAVAVAIPFAAVAADKMSHSVLGWSADGRYFAFERSVVLDGSGYPMCEVLEDDRISPEHACVAARDQAQQALESRRIDPALTGRRLELAPARPAPGDDRGTRFTLMSFRESGRSCTLRLAQRPAPSPAPEFPLSAWQLALSCGEEEQILRCTECGKEPPVASGIAIVEVRSRHGRIVAVLARSTRGFEGMDVTPIVATAHLPAVRSGGGRRPPGRD